MAYKRLNIADIMGVSGKMSPKEAAFVIEYSKDFDPRRSAAAAGYAPDMGYKLRDRDHVKQVLDQILQHRLDASHIDAEWLLMELVDNHVIARANGNITASNTALGIIAKHASVDAFAAEKVQVAGADEIRERLLRARKRLSQTPPEVH